MSYTEKFKTTIGKTSVYAELWDHFFASVISFKNTFKIMCFDFGNKMQGIEFADEN